MLNPSADCSLGRGVATQLTATAADLTVQTIAIGLGRDATVRALESIKKRFKTGEIPVSELTPIDLVWIEQRVAAVLKANTLESLIIGGYLQVSEVCDGVRTTTGDPISLAPLGKSLLMVDRAQWASYIWEWCANTIPGVMSQLNLDRDLAGESPGELETRSARQPHSATQTHSTTETRGATETHSADQTHAATARQVATAVPMATTSGVEFQPEPSAASGATARSGASQDIHTTAPPIAMTMPRPTEVGQTTGPANKTPRTEKSPAAMPRTAGRFQGTWNARRTSQTGPPPAAEPSRGDDAGLMAGATTINQAPGNMMRPDSSNVLISAGDFGVLATRAADPAPDTAHGMTLAEAIPLLSMRLVSDSMADDIAEETLVRTSIPGIQAALCVGDDMWIAPADLAAWGITAEMAVEMAEAQLRANAAPEMSIVFLNDSTPVYVLETETPGVAAFLPYLDTYVPIRESASAVVVAALANEHVLFVHLATEDTTDAAIHTLIENAVAEHTHRPGRINPTMFRWSPDGTLEALTPNMHSAAGRLEARQLVSSGQLID